MCGWGIVFNLPPVGNQNSLLYKWGWVGGCHTGVGVPSLLQLWLRRVAKDGSAALKAPFGVLDAVSSLNFMCAFIAASSDL